MKSLLDDHFVNLSHSCFNLLALIVDTCKIALGNIPVFMMVTGIPAVMCFVTVCRNTILQIQEASEV